MDFRHETSAIFPSQNKKIENHFGKKKEFFPSKRSFGHEKFSFDNTANNLLIKSSFW